MKIRGAKDYYMKPRLRVTCLPERVTEPLKALVKTITGCGTSGLDILHVFSFVCRLLMSS